MKKTAILNILSIFFIAIAFSLLIPTGLLAEESEMIILKIILNKFNAGDFFLKTNKEKDIFITPEDFKKIGFKEIPLKAKFNNDGYISFRSLYPEVSFILIEEDPTVELRVDPLLLQGKSIDFSYKPPVKVSHLTENSAYINYQANLNYNEESKVISLNLPTEVAVRTGNFLTYSNFNYNVSQGEFARDHYDSAARMFSNITIDSSKYMQRIVLGDFIASSGDGLGAGGILGGISISKNFSLSPYFVKVPELSLSGILKTPSEVKLYINDNLIATEYFQSGKFEFLNLPAHSGRGTIRLEIKDDYGRVSKINTTFQRSASILKPGLHEYSYNLGFKRKNLGKKNFDYDSPVFVFSHRLGFSDYFTAGIRGEGNIDAFNIGPSYKLLLGSLGELDISVAFSHIKNKVGFGTNIYYANSFKNLFCYMSLKRYTENYSSSLNSTTYNMARIEGAASLGFSSGLIGSITASVSVVRPDFGKESKVASISYSKSLWNNFYFLLNASRAESTVKTDLIFLGFRFIFGRSFIGNVDYHIQEDSRDLSLNIQKTPETAMGTSYNINVQRNEPRSYMSTYNINTNIRHNNQNGNFSIDYVRSNNTNNYSFGYAGALSLVSKSVNFSNPIYGSFALVKTGKLQGVDVKLNGNSYGKTNTAGEIVLANLSPNYPNKINIAPQNIPLEYSLPKTEKNISVSYKGGGLVSFPVIRLKAFEGNIFIYKNGEKEAVEFTTFYYIIDGETIENITSNRGMFYLENIPVGRLNGWLETDEGTCNFNLQIVENDEMISDLGDVICETK